LAQLGTLKSLRHLQIPSAPVSDDDLEWLAALDLEYLIGVTQLGHWVSYWSP
jgi:hypothetical protein